MRKVWLSPLVVLALSGYGCSAAPGPNEFGVGGSGTGGATGTTTGDIPSGVGGTNFSGTGTGGSSGATGGGSDCSDAAKLIYVLSTDNDLYSFNPPQKVFKKIGPLGCNTPMLPNSMAVDRNAVAYVNYVETDPFSGDTAGAVFKVSTADASCKSTPIKLGDGWFRLGMGFSSDSVQGTSEQLFITGTGNTIGSGSSPGLGRIDLTASTVVPVGQFTGQLSGQNAELTGTGDARLFGFFTTSPVEVAELDKKSGAVVSTKKLPQVETPAAWAFSFWGGDFYLYTAPDMATNPGRTTNVSRYRPSDGTTDPAYMTNIGFTIVGAGVSTCAPVEPPK
jgi:hypothetical protein